MKDKVTIITAAENIIKACRFLKVDVIEHKPFGLKDFRQENRYVNDEIERLNRIIDQDEFHFSHTQFALFCFCLAKKINDRRGRTIFHSFELVYKKQNVRITDLLSKQYWYIKIYKDYLKIKYNLPVEIRRSSSNAYVISLKLEYVQKRSFRIVEDKTSYFETTNLMFKNFKFDYPSINHIFVAQTFDAPDLFDEARITRVLPLIDQSHISLKNHPKLGAVKGLENCKTLPDYLPVELFFQKVKGSVISFHSASLVTASKFENVDAISIIELVRTNDPFIDTVMRYLKDKSDGRIRFVSELDELKNVINV